MGEFFKLWRRKIGLLALACVFAAGWLRSLICHDRVGLPLNIGLLSGNQRLVIGLFRPPPLPSMYLNDDVPEPQGIAFPRSISDSILVAETIVPYGLIVMPLTLLSAWRMLSKRRPSKLAESLITTAN